MSQILKVLGIISIVGGIILGIVYGAKDSPAAIVFKVDESFRFVVALTWWISGAISGILFLAFASMLEYLQSNNAMLRELSSRVPSTPHKPLGNSKASLDSAVGYKMKTSD
ncbi:hypothetical protein J2T13_000888 [Paenibacillus sp. DS2015]|uniref:hypothetical protein n=1 Tax=Paenibacillus sp. DS2015 TaxID=3373917 RepID=UPI003D1D771C